MNTRNIVISAELLIVSIAAVLVYLMINTNIGLIILFGNLLVILLIPSLSKKELEEKVPSIAKPKTIEKKKVIAPPTSSSIEISREFIIEGDLIGFFVSIKNNLDSAIKNVVVRIQIPPSIKLDYNTPSKTFKIGEIAHKKEAQAKFYIAQIGEDETLINATIEYKDNSDSYQITKIQPFKITSSKSIVANIIDPKEFTTEFEKVEYETLIIPLTEELQEDKIREMIKKSIFMNTINDTREVLEMTGKTPSESLILFKSMILRTNEGLQLYASVASKDQADRLSLLFDVKNAFKDNIRTIPEQFEDLSLD